MKALDEIYSALLDALARTATPHAFIGALAAIAWGRPRATTDIDVVIACDEAAFARLREALLSLGFSEGRGVGPSDPADALPDIAVFWAGPPPQTRIDIFIAKLEFERAVIATARRARVFDRDVPTASPEAMLIYKLLANRPKDALDVDAIVAVRKLAGEPLDWAFLERWANEWGIADRLAALRER